MRFKKPVLHADGQVIVWHKWFAWYPVRIVKTEQLVWMETVEKQDTFHITIFQGCYFTSEYRLVHK